MKMLLHYVKRYWYFALFAPLFMMGEVLMDLTQPGLMRIIVDEGVLGLSSGGVGDLSIILSYGRKMVACVALGGMCGVLSGVFSIQCSQRFGNDLRKDCFKRIMSFSFQQTDRFSTGSLVTRITNDITQVQRLVMQCMRGFVRTGMMFVGGIVCMLQLNLSFGVVIACALPVVICVVVYFLRRANPIFKLLQRKLDRVNAVMQENVAGSRIVKAYVMEEHEKERFDKANTELSDTQLRVLLIFSYMTPIMNIIMNSVVVAVIWVGSIKVNAGRITPGIVMQAITYTTQIMHSIMMIVNIFQTISRGAASASRLREVLECEPAIADGGFDGETERHGSVEFRNVSFGYPNSSAVLEGINLRIEPGETFGILGSTGCGKSSLVNLIPRFYDATAGSVLVDGVDVREYKLDALRRRVAIALQRSELFNTTVRENLSWGDPNAGDAELEQAAQTAQAAEFIETREHGYDEMIEQQGSNLSGGQKQRMSIARAVLKKAEILIFDDATSALDLKTEERLYSELKQSCPGVTKIIIAQRIASLKHADRIAVLDGGRVAACGSHEELMRTSSIYRDIYNSQLGDGGDGNG